jgi:hypothetical protein
MVSQLVQFAEVVIQLNVNLFGLLFTFKEANRTKVGHVDSSVLTLNL